jgi:hypothetical protein
MWEKVKAWFKRSLTIVWARIVALVGLLLAAGEQLLQDPNINSAVQSALQPKLIHSLLCHRHRPHHRDRSPSYRRTRMIAKSGNRFSEKIMRNIIKRAQ